MRSLPLKYWDGSGMEELEEAGTSESGGMASKSFERVHV